MLFCLLVLQESQRFIVALSHELLLLLLVTLVKRALLLAGGRV